MLKTGQPSPELTVKTLDLGQWSLSKSNPETFTLIIVYRGLHCPVCKKYLKDLNSKIKKFTKLGVKVIAISHDSKEKALKAQKEWGLDKLTIGYEMDLAHLNEWGLYFSKSINKEEPEFFIEPGLFMVMNDGILYSAIISTMPFARPGLKDILSAIEYINKNHYPPRGTAII